MSVEHGCPPAILVLRRKRHSKLANQSSRIVKLWVQKRDLGSKNKGRATGDVSQCHLQASTYTCRHVDILTNAKYTDNNFLVLCLIANCSFLLLEIFLPTLYDCRNIYLVLIAWIFDGTVPSFNIHPRGGFQDIGHNFKHLFNFLVSIFVTNMSQSMFIFNCINTLSKQLKPTFSSNTSEYKLINYNFLEDMSNLLTIFKQP